MCIGRRFIPHDSANLGGYVAATTAAFVIACGSGIDSKAGDSASAHVVAEKDCPMSTVSLAAWPAAQSVVGNAVLRVPPQARHEILSRADSGRTEQWDARGLAIGIRERRSVDSLPLLMKMDVPDYLECVATIDGRRFKVATGYFDRATSPGQYLSAATQIGESVSLVIDLHGFDRSSRDTLLAMLRTLRLR